MEGKPDSFFPYEHVLGTMLHELTHIERGPHDAKFYKLLDELNEAGGWTNLFRACVSHCPNPYEQECDDLIARGITGTPFGGSGHRLGSSPYPSIRPVRLGTAAAAAAAASAADSSSFRVVTPAGPSSAPSAADGASRKAAAAAAERRRQQQRIMMPVGGRRLGGDSEIMKVLSPVQAAAMAAERRMRDDVWCGGHGSEGGEGGEGGDRGQGGAREKEEEEWESAREVREGNATGEASQAGGARKRPSVTEEQSSRSRKMPASSAVASKRADATRERFTDGSRGGDVSGGEQQAAGAGRAEGAEGVGREDNWTCRVCTLINRCTLGNGGGGGGGAAAAAAAAGAVDHAAR
ncbi:unnamed protein product [Closterium sp. NIES-64]|nr:unnamed protein product [Closterium sp. NIES-64]